VIVYNAEGGAVEMDAPGITVKCTDVQRQDWRLVVRHHSVGDVFTRYDHPWRYARPHVHSLL